MSGRNGKADPEVLSRPEPAEESAVARRRRDEIIEAATDIIATEGLHRLSLARIEGRTGMTRGQLTYYFPAKEEILLAVFDRMLARMIAEAMADASRTGAPLPGSGAAWDGLRHGFGRMLRDAKPDDQLAALVHTFMAQVGHRDDFRQKLAATNANWRALIAADISSSNTKTSPVPPAIAASVVMALFQGLSGQLAVDPVAFDRTAMLDACIRVLVPLLGPPVRPDSGGDRA